MEYNNLEHVLKLFCQELEDNYKEKLRSSNKGDGELYETFKVSYEIKDKSFIVKYEAPDYFKYVEYGRSPGKFPPKESIQEWASKRGINDKSAVFLISRKIAEEGIKPTNFFNESYEELKDKYDNEIKRAILKDFEEYSEKTLKNIKVRL